MTEALIVLAVALLASIWVTFLVARMLNDGHRNLEAQWAKERDKLLERIQRPDRIPAAPRTDFVVPEREPDEWGKVGSVEIDENWLNGTDG